MALTQVPIELSSTPGIVDNSNATAITIDSSENVGIGTDSPNSYSSQTTLTINGSTYGRFDLESAGTLRASLFATTGSTTLSAATDVLSFDTSGGEAMRIDSSGNLLVGTTDTDPANNSANSTADDGVAITAVGEVRSSRYLATANSGAVGFFNRTGTDGDIIRLRKSGSTVGSIGTEGGDLAIGNDNAGIQFVNGTQTVRPFNMNTNARIDAQVDLGMSSTRFKDLYLSGTMVGNLVKLRTDSTSMYVSPTTSNTLNGNYDSNTDEGDMWINYRGYQDTFDRFRDFRIGNGKGAVIVFVDGSAASVAITGSLSISSSLSKGSGSFKIDHPLPAKTETHHLVHSFVEAPQADNIYRGKVDLVGGSATVNIDTAAGMTEGTYVLLNTNTQCFTSNESGWTAVKGSVSGNTLTITAQDNTCTDTISWLVVGERQDQHMIDTDWTDDNGKVIVEPLKENN